MVYRSDACFKHVSLQSGWLIPTHQDSKPWLMSRYTTVTRILICVVNYLRYNIVIQKKHSPATYFESYSLYRWTLFLLADDVYMYEHINILLLRRSSYLTNIQRASFEVGSEDVWCTLSYWYNWTVCSCVADTYLTRSNLPCFVYVWTWMRRRRGTDHVYRSIPTLCATNMNT